MYNQSNHLPTQPSHTHYHLRSLDPKRWNPWCISGGSVFWCDTCSLFFQVPLLCLGPTRATVQSWPHAPSIGQDPQELPFRVLSNSLALLIYLPPARGWSNAPGVEFQGLYLAVILRLFGWDRVPRGTSICWQAQESFFTVHYGNWITRTTQLIHWFDRFLYILGKGQIQMLG